MQRPPKLLTHRWWKGTQSVLIWCHEVLVKAKCRSIGHCQVLCCESNLVPLYRWWTSLVLPRLAGGNYEWVSGLQMYVEDFCFAVNGPWPIMVSGRWLERNEAVQRQYATTTFSRRIKMFLTLWKAYIQANKLVVPAMLRRPKSSCIAFWCQCYKLPWSRERLVEIDRILLGLLAHVDHSALFNIPIYKGKIFPLS